MAAAAINPIFPDDPFDPTLLPPRNILSLSQFEISRKEKDKNPRKVKLFGEAHLHLPKEKAYELTDENVRFFHNELMENPNAKLFIESFPEYADGEAHITGSVLNDAAKRLASLHKARVNIVDRRKEPAYEHLSKLPSSSSKIKQIKARDEIEKIASKHYEKYPNFKNVVDRETDLKNVGRPPFASPLFDSQILDIIEQAKKEGFDPIFYTGNAHQKNVSEALRDSKGVKGSGIQGGLFGLDSLMNAFNVFNKVVDIRRDLSPADKAFKTENGNQLIVSLNVLRTPLKKYVNSALNILTLGKFQEAVKQNGFDQLFHLFIQGKLQNGVEFILEKNETIQLRAYKASDVNSQTELKSVDVAGKNITINSLFENAENTQKDRFWAYDGLTNNCQDFVIAVLGSSGLLTPDLEYFIKQNAQGIAETINDRNPIASSIMKGTTDFAAKMRRVFGLGLDD